MRSLKKVWEATARLTRRSGSGSGCSTLGLDVRDAVRSGRPSTVCDEDHVAQGSALLEEDSRYTCEEVAG